MNELLLFLFIKHHGCVRLCAATRIILRIETESTEEKILTSVQGFLSTENLALQLTWWPRWCHRRCCRGSWCSRRARRPTPLAASPERTGWWTRCYWSPTHWSAHQAGDTETQRQEWLVCMTLSNKTLFFQIGNLPLSQLGCRHSDATALDVHVYVFVWLRQKKHLLCHICTKQCAKWLNTVQIGQICLLTLNTTHTHTHTHTQPLSHKKTHTHTHSDHSAAAEYAGDACSKLIRELGCHSHLHQTTAVYCTCVSICAWVNVCHKKKKEKKK